MNMLAGLKEKFSNGRRPPLKALSASGQLGYGVLEPAFLAGVALRPDFIGADMGSVDPGPNYLGSGEMATTRATTERDLAMLLKGARELAVPLIIGSAGTGGAGPHLEATLAIVREIAAAEGLHFPLAAIRADIDKAMVLEAHAGGRLTPLGPNIEAGPSDIEASSHIVGQMGTEAICRALEAGAEVVVAGRACDTAIFAALPRLLNFTEANTLHMAKIIECASQCCLPGGRLTPLGPNIEATPADIEASSHIVGQMGTEAICRALEAGAEVVVAGRACDTAIFAALPRLLNFAEANTLHMAKIIECASQCCLPGGRDAMLGTLDDGGFVLESMNPERHATPMSVAAHSLYEQASPYIVVEPEGSLHLETAEYEALDGHRTRVKGAAWEWAEQWTVKIEAAAPVGERAILLSASIDPRFIAALDEIIPAVKQTVREIAPPDPEHPYRLEFRVYGIDGVMARPEKPAAPPREVFILGECLAQTLEEAKTVTAVAKQYLLHHGFPGRLSTAGNIAFPFTPPEVACGTAYRFSLFHVMEVDELAPLFPVSLEKI